MAAAPEPLLITVEQYRQLANRQDCVQELHWGEIVNVSFPKPIHVKLQDRLATLLRPRAAHLGYVLIELPFRAVPEYDIRAADVAFISRERWDSVGDHDLRGAPELAIEVLSPSNTRAELREKAVLCFSAGTQEFWIVDPKNRTVTVTTRDGSTAIYGEQDRIPLSLFGGELEVAEVFVP
jgi:Uma2 family endonuclease